MNTDSILTTYVGNSKILSDNIQNFSANPYRRVDLKAQLDHSVDPADAVARLEAKLAAIPNVKTSPAPDVELLEFTLASPVLAVCPYTHTDHCWQVYFDANRVIREVGAEAKYPAPKQHFGVDGPLAPPAR